jgi:methylthioxylose transferase
VNRASAGASAPTADPGRHVGEATPGSVRRVGGGSRLGEGVPESVRGVCAGRHVGEAIPGSVRRVGGGPRLGEGTPTSIGSKQGSPHPMTGVTGTVSSGAGAFVAVFAAAALIVWTRLWGARLTDGGAVLHLAGGYPLAGQFDPRLQPGLVLPVALGLACVWWLPQLTARLPWRSVVGVSGMVAAGWAVLLALTDGVSALTRPLEDQHEYLSDVPRVTDLLATLDAFTVHVPAGAPGFTWNTHVAGHPPGALFSFVALDRLGLGGAGWAAVLCIVVGASAAGAVLVTLRLLGGETAARLAAPYVAVAPAALWIATAADALFAGVAAWGVCALAYAATRPGRGGDASAAVGGILLGGALLLSYGLVLMAPIATAAVLVQRRTRPLAVAALGIAAVAGGCAIIGFWWLDGLSAAAERVRAGPAWQDRPSAYFLVANVAALCIAAGPATVAGLALLRRRSVLGRAVVVPLAALLAMTLGLASTLSKGEVERIYLPFLIWLLPVGALLPTSRHRVWLAATVAMTLAVQMCWRLKW